MPTVVITGASQGIGAAVAETFATTSNAHVVLLARNPENLEAVAQRCESRGATASFFPCDVTDADAVASTAEAVLAQTNRVDVLVNNAGLFQPGSILDTSPEVFRAQVEVNLNSAFLVTRAFLPAMIDAGQGHLFYMASVASIRAYAGGSAYCAAKHGLLGLARVVREETKTHGLRVTTLLPGATLTPSWAGTELPEARFMPPEDIAQAVLDAYHLSDRTVIEEMILRPQLGDI
ncbi:MAG: SDR family oxidoreductase [Bacteroidota bacterium]